MIFECVFCLENILQFLLILDFGSSKSEDDKRVCAGKWRNGITFTKVKHETMRFSDFETDTRTVESCTFIICFFSDHGDIHLTKFHEQFDNCSAVLLSNAKSAADYLKIKKKDFFKKALVPVGY